MAKYAQGVKSATEQAVKDITAQSGVKTAMNVASHVGGVIGDARQLAGNAVLLTFSKLWLGVGVAMRGAKTEAKASGYTVDKYVSIHYNNEKSETPTVDRYDTSKMWSMRFGEYFMPLSQSFAVHARKKLNISSLVDGVDVIQQTRKEAKTIDCTLKISVNDAQRNLQIIREDEEKGTREIAYLQQMLSDLYENDVVFAVDNDTLNNTFGIDYVIMESFKFIPRAGSKTYVFEFSLTEVKFGDNILTFDEKQIKAAETTTETE